ncbi:dienelactone hydrolase family protein [Vogesella indigofera]|uniref:dienelactone hydrolase family protein n=1 Tax=Vogesella indigofera TaxID=45465 RepID=UPI00234C9D27|nr:dienelactone hydrolase family protein [Vogesella indigofera]MDC7705059.1 dienelactone hydrolase family protein [Vogesella indigofera]
MSQEQADPLPLPDEVDPQRRLLISAVLAGGFALAAQPVTAATIHTDSDGLVAGWHKAGPDLLLYAARPAQGSQWPVVLVVQEIFGVHEHIQDVCRRLAKQGYLAVAPELFLRQGDARGYPDTAALIANVVSKVPDAQVLADLDATLEYARVLGGNSARAAITGFCWGGRITWLYAAHNPRIKAGAAWYGRLLGQETALTPRHPVAVAPQLTVPVLGLYGGKDGGIPLDSVATMKTALQQGSSGSEFVVYPDAGHAFNADYRPSYHAPSAEDGWRRMLQWFRRHGV